MGNDMSTFELADHDAELFACRLDPAEQKELMTRYASIGRDHLLDIHRQRASLTIVLSRTGDTEAAVDRIVAIEAECCLFMLVNVDRQADRQTLTYSGPDMVEPVIEMIAERLRSDPPNAPR